MREVIRLSALAAILVAATVCWMVFGGIMLGRSGSQESALHGAVADLWGQPLSQNAPTAQLTWTETVDRLEDVRDANGNVVYHNGEPMQRMVRHHSPQSRTLALASTDLVVDLALDQRRKGLMWFPLYDVDFQGTWTVVPEEVPEGAQLWLTLDFPYANGVYDDFRFEVDGVEMADRHPPENGRVTIPAIPVEGQPVSFRVGYASRGMTEWTYHPTQGVGQLRDFELSMTTDFTDIDYPSFALAPSAKEPTSTGWKLDWTFNRLVTAYGMGMVMPENVQPGELAASMSFSAPISLGLFMLWIYVIGLIRQVDIHPVNHLFLAATFFSFHLLFGYTVDHIPVEAAFVLSSCVSLFLTVSYLRLVAGPKFAVFQAGGAQLLYLVGFSLAHFWEGFTGLTVTVLGIVTLFALGQLTGRVPWTEVFGGRGPGMFVPPARGGRAVSEG